MLRHRNEYPVEGLLPALDGATAWLNTQPVTAGALQGRVVLVSFGTYTCINWIRSLPYVRAWADKYAGQGLAVIGVQTPEFEFEDDLDGVGSPSRLWTSAIPWPSTTTTPSGGRSTTTTGPLCTSSTRQGRIRHHRFGEGEYQESERVLQMLLAEAGADVDRDLVRLEPQGVELPADWDHLGSAENYVGYERTAGVRLPGRCRCRTSATATPRRRRWGATSGLCRGTGAWGRSPPSLEEPGGAISCDFHARDLHLVMRPAVPHASVRFRVRLDGRPPGPAHGLDVDEDGNGVVSGQRLYQLVRQPGPIADRRFDIEFLDAGVEASCSRSDNARR